MLGPFNSEIQESICVLFIRLESRNRNLISIHWSHASFSALVWWPPRHAREMNMIWFQQQKIVCSVMSLLVSIKPPHLGRFSLPISIISASMKLKAWEQRTRSSMAMRGEATNQFPRPNAWVWGERGTGTDTNGRRRNWSLVGSLHQKKKKEAESISSFGEWCASAKDKLCGNLGERTRQGKSLSSCNWHPNICCFEWTLGSDKLCVFAAFFCSGCAHPLWLL